MKKRVITALILVSVIVPVVLLGGIPYLVGIMALMGVCMFELTNVNNSPLITRIISILFVSASSLYTFFNIDNALINFNLLFIFVPILTYFTISMFSKEGTLLDASYNSVTTILLSLFASSLLELRYVFNNANLLLYLLLVTTSVDTFALFVGTKLGKNKLNKRISPNKSIEGSVGGIVGGVILGTVFTIFFPIFTSNDASFLNISFAPDFSITNIMISFAITLALTIIGQIGDLVFSMIKRHYNIKDFSNVLPGHGGFADRVDSLCFNSIALALVLSMMFIL